jgi:pimeloyl-ACP methyl ester carboxylesterase
MTTFVLVHGGGHGGWCFRKVRRLLEAEGHTVFAPTLTGLGERKHLLTPEVDLETHVSDIANLLFYEDLRDVVLVGHSYAGMVIAGAADRALDRVAKLVYLDAVQPTNGQSVIDAITTFLKPMVRAHRDSSQIIDGVELVMFPSDFPDKETYGVTDPEDIAWMAPRLTPHPWVCFDQPLVMQHGDQVAALPTYHIGCTLTLSIQDDQEKIATARSEGRLWEIDSGHDLMITEPGLVTEALIKISAAG